MKLSTPQIVWHSKEPVYSADFHHSGELWRLVTGGADKDIKIWKIVQEERKVKVVFMASLSRHAGTINVVRFSPNGEFLASAGDDNVVCLWKLGEGGGAGNSVAMDTTTPNEENWSVTKMLRGHLEDIYDGCWSANSTLLATGSVDNTTIVWDINKGQSLYVLRESKQYVQGVSWDPIGQYLATLSNDRYLRIYSADQKYKCVHTIGKMTAPEQEKGAGSKQFRMWIDESLSFFFRRLAFSPDGNLLVVPAGRFENGDKVTNTTYIFTKANLTKPAVCLPGPEKATVVVKFCPMLFELRDSIEEEKGLFNLPYRMVYAVASLDAVLVYDTQQTSPFAYFSNMHYSGITDLAWSDDGLVLVVTSSDAYCSIVTFEPGELGVALATEKIPMSMRQSENEEKKTGTVSAEEVVASSRNTKGETSPVTRSSPNSERVKENDTKSTEVSPDHEAGHSVGREGRGPDGGASQENTATASATATKTDAVKGKKRRIQTSVVEIFNSSSSVKSEASLQKTQPETNSRITSSPDDTATTPVCVVTSDGSRRNSESENINVATSANTTQNSTIREKKPRRIQLETLSPVPLQMSRDLDTKSHDHDSTHSLDPNDDNVEPMEIPSIE